MVLELGRIGLVLAFCDCYFWPVLDGFWLWFESFRLMLLTFFISGSFGGSIGEPEDIFFTGGGGTLYLVVGPPGVTPVAFLLAPLSS